MEDKDKKIFHPGARRYLGRSLLHRWSAPENHPWSRVPSAVALDPTLSRTDLLTLILLCRYVGANGCTYVSQSTIAALRGVSRQQIGKSLDRLRRRFWISSLVCYRPNSKERTTDWLTVHYKPLPERKKPDDD